MRNKWESNNSSIEKEYRVILFVSRNKDNVNLENFKERRESYFLHYDGEKVKRKFRDFVNGGIPGEFCRMYVSNNARDPVKVHKELLKLLIDKDNFNFDYLTPTVAGIAARKECAAEKKWFFDFDSADKSLLNEFESDIRLLEPNLQIEHLPTPHGFAVIVDRGFDTRTLLKKWGDIVALKRDDLICVRWEKTDE